MSQEEASRAFLDTARRYIDAARDATCPQARACFEERAQHALEMAQSIDANRKPGK